MFKVTNEVHHFRIGDSVVCVNNSSRNYDDTKLFDVNISIGKTYYIKDIKVGVGYEGLCIIDDNSDTKNYNRDRFILLREYRKQKLERCLK